MAEITRPGPLVGVRLVDFTTEVMDTHTAQIFGDLGADVMKLEAPMTQCVGGSRSP